MPTAPTALTSFAHGRSIAPFVGTLHLAGVPAFVEKKHATLIVSGGYFLIDIISPHPARLNASSRSAPNVTTYSFDPSTGNFEPHHSSKRMEIKSLTLWHSAWQIAMKIVASHMQGMQLLMLDPKNAATYHPFPADALERAQRYSNLLHEIATRQGSNDAVALEYDAWHRNNITLWFTPQWDVEVKEQTMALILR